MDEFKNINTFILDVDGVLTDGSVLSLASGEQVRSFYIKDGFALKKAVLAGYDIIIISGGLEEGVRQRLEFLGIKDIYLGVSDKVSIYEKHLKKKEIDKEKVLYMGDDIPDLKMLRIVGLPCCPNDAAPDVKEVCTYISPFNGGRGAARDVLEKTMKAQGKWLKDEW